MQMVQRALAADVFGFSGGRGDPPVKRLTELRHHDRRARGGVPERPQRRFRFVSDPHTLSFIRCRYGAFAHKAAPHPLRPTPYMTPSPCNWLHFWKRRIGVATVNRAPNALSMTARPRRRHGEVIASLAQETEPLSRKKADLWVRSDLEEPTRLLKSMNVSECVAIAAQSGAN